MRRPLLPCLVLLGAGLLAPASPAGEYQDLIDLANAQLFTRQDESGLFDDDPLITARILVALQRGPRHYGISDGPFMRRAMEALETAVSPGGSIAESDDLFTRALGARWALEASRGLAGDLPGRVAQQARTLLGAHPLPDRADPRYLTGLAEHPMRQSSDALDTLLTAWAPRLASLDGESLADLPGLLEARAASAPLQPITVARAEGALEGPWVWVVGEVAKEYADWPASLASAPSDELVDLCLVFSLCERHAVPPESADAPDVPTSQDAVRRGRIQGDLHDAYRAAASEALTFLESQQQDGRFLYMGRVDPGVTAMALASIVPTCQRLGLDRPTWVDAGLDWLISLQDDDGSIHGGNLKVYVTSSAMLALTKAQRGGADEDVIARAGAYLIAVQSDEGEGYDSELDWAYGGIGYGGDLRPDMSNTQFAVEAMHEAETTGREAAFSKARRFLERSQNRAESNTLAIEQADGTTFVAGNDGGATYYPGNSKAGKIMLPDGTAIARSYGSMTYALLKCYLFCGLPKEDPRVQAALSWIQSNYTLEYNPGMNQPDRPGAEFQGLYYYYFSMAKALDASGLEVVQTPDGTRHRWRDELSRHLLREGFRGGFWINDKSSRWWEELPTLATAYTLSALDHSLPAR